MTVLSELEKNLPAAYRDSLALEKKSKLWKHVFHPLKITGAGGRKAKNAETIYQALKEQKELLENRRENF